MSHPLSDQNHAPSGVLITEQTIPPRANTHQSASQKQKGRTKRWSLLWIVALLVVFLAGYLIGHKMGSTPKNAQLGANTAIPTLSVSTTVPIATSGGTLAPTQTSGGSLAPTQISVSTIVPTQTIGGTLAPTQVSGSAVPTQTSKAATVPTQTSSGTLAPTPVSVSTTVPVQASGGTTQSTGSTSTTQATGSTSTAQAPTAQSAYLFSSTTGGVTQAFKILPNWVLQWTCNPASLSSIRQYNLLVNVINGSDMTPLDPLAVNTVCKAGNTSGQIYEKRGGTLYLDIDTEGAWTVTVQQ